MISVKYAKVRDLALFGGTGAANDVKVDRGRLRSSSNGASVLSYSLTVVLGVAMWLFSRGYLP
jgi:hypothetical protein